MIRPTAPRHVAHALLALSIALGVLAAWPGEAAGQGKERRVDPAGGAGRRADERKRDLVRPGRPAPPFQLPNLSGKAVELAQFVADPKRRRDGFITVWVWWSATGPVAAKTDPIVVALAKKFHRKGVRFFAINPLGASKKQPSTTESTRVIREFKRLRKIDFPVLIDQKRKVTRLYCVTRVPEVVVIDRRGIVRYRGAIVARPPRAGVKRGVPHLQRALEDLVAGKVLRKAETKPWGNSIP